MYVYKYNKIIKSFILRHLKITAYAETLKGNFTPVNRLMMRLMYICIRDQQWVFKKMNRIESYS